MSRSGRTVFLLIYFIVAVLYMEIIFRVTTHGDVFSDGLILAALFLLPFAISFFIICSIFPKKVNFIFSIIILIISGFIFASQMVYYDVFTTYYSVFSAANFSQILDFKHDILLRIGHNAYYVFLFFIPAILLILPGRKIFSFRRIQPLVGVVLILVVIICHLFGVTAVSLGGKGHNSSYDLYFRTSYPVLSVNRLGLLTTMRLDMQRLLFGWTPDLAVSNPYLHDDLEEISDDKGKNEREDYIDSKEENKDDIEEEEKIIEYNTMDIDFEFLISKEDRDEIIKMHEYFMSVPPTNKNEYTGKYKGYNLILITAEAFSSFAVDEDITPTLYKMVNEGYNFTDFYVPLWDVSTSDGEYMGLNSLIPKTGVWSFYYSGSNHMPLVMGNQLKKLGYTTKAYHNHTYSYYERHISHPNMGYEYKGVGKGLNVKKQWPASDLEMMEVTIPEYIESQPFHAYYMTVSGHLEYNFMGNMMAIKNRQYVEDLPYSTQAKAYLATQIELDRALEHLLNELDEAGIAEKTLIALSTDHYPYGLDDDVIDELAGHSVERNFELHKSPFILYTKGMEPRTIDRPCSNLDIVPTLSNLLGIEYDSRLLMGRDIFSDSEPVVVFRNRSFITDKGRYNAQTEEFFSKGDIPVDEEYINRILSIVDSKFYYSTKILDNDYYSIVLP